MNAFDSEKISLKSMIVLYCASFVFLLCINYEFTNPRRSKKLLVTNAHNGYDAGKVSSTIDDNNVSLFPYSTSFRMIDALCGR